jgi:hypothetical protein
MLKQVVDNSQLLPEKTKEASFVGFPVIWFSSHVFRPGERRPF